MHFETDVSGRRWMLIPVDPCDAQIDVLRHAVIEGDLHHRQTYSTILGMTPERDTGLMPLVDGLMAIALKASGDSYWASMGRQRPSMSPSHVVEMLSQIKSGAVCGEKAHRWIGWAQAAMVAGGVTHLGAMMSMTRDCLHPSEPVDIEEPLT